MISRYLIYILVLLCFKVFGQEALTKPSCFKLPYAVKTGFESIYPDVKDVWWQVLDNEYYWAMFIKNNVSFKQEFDSTGHLTSAYRYHDTLLYNDKIPKNINDSFKFSYPNAMHIIWKISDNEFTATFYEQHNQQYESYVAFDSRGAIIYIDRDFPDAELLPTLIKTYIEDKFSGIEIEGKEELHNNKHQFNLLVSKNDTIKLALTFDGNGKLTKKRRIWLQRNRKAIE